MEQITLQLSMLHITTKIIQDLKLLLSIMNLLAIQFMDLMEAIIITKMILKFY